MTWLRRYRLWHFVRYSIWLLPVIGMFVGMGTVRSLYWFDTETGWVSKVDPEGTRAVLGTLSGSMFTFIVFVCSALLVAFQLASAQLTPRIIGIVFRDAVVQWSLTLFVFSFTVSLSAQIRITDVVPLMMSKTASASSRLRRKGKNSRTTGSELSS